MATDYQSKVEFSVSVSGSPGCNMTSFFPILHNSLLPSEILGLPKVPRDLLLPPTRGSDLIYDIMGLAITLKLGTGCYSHMSQIWSMTWGTCWVQQPHGLFLVLCLWTIQHMTLGCGYLVCKHPSHWSKRYPFRWNTNTRSHIEAHSIYYQTLWYLMLDLLSLETGIVAFWSWISAF